MRRLFFLLLVVLGVSAIVFGALRLQAVLGAPVIIDEPAPKVEPRRLEAFPMEEGRDRIAPASATDSFLNKLRRVPIAHETPKTAQFGRPFEVTVAIDATGDTSAADALPGQGQIVEADVLVSADVEASLSGDAFSIAPVSPLTQTLSPLTENIWRWQVTPLETGPQSLTIELFALNGDRAMPLRTFRDRVEVQVSPLGQAVALAHSLSPVAVLVGGVGSLLAGLLGIFRFFRKR
jgi:hypothetical protein